MQGMFQIAVLCRQAGHPAHAAFEPEIGGAPDSAVQGQGCAAGEMRDCLQIARADLICRRIARAAATRLSDGGLSPLAFASRRGY